MTRFTAIALAFSLVFGRGLAAQSIAGSPTREEGVSASSDSERDWPRAIHRAASRAAQDDSQEHRVMPKGFQWTGVSLVGYGGFLFLLGVGYGPDHLDCPGGDCRVCNDTCPKTQDTLFRGGRLFVASGAAVLAVGAAIGARRSSPDLAPRVTLGREGLAIQQPVPLRRWWHRK